MKLLGYVLWILVGTSCVVSFSPEALDYVLRTLEYLESVESGMFSCVFYDLSAQSPYDNILGAILKSPRLDHVIKYATGGQFREAFEDLPRDPSMLLIHPRNDAAYFDPFENKKSIVFLLKLFNPTTKVLVFVNASNELLAQRIQEPISFVGFTHPVFLDPVTMRVTIFNAIGNSIETRVPDPMHLFTWGQRMMKGRNITYLEVRKENPFTWNNHWMEATARYLNTEASEYVHSCGDLKGIKLLKCLNERNGNRKPADIVLMSIYLWEVIPRDFRHFFTGIPLFTRIAVPRDRPLNIAEIMLLPFTWQVWMLLMLILVSTEVCKHIFPRFLQNDPFLLIVCGFERHDLHRASRCEKIIFLPLIILMFFMTNAFETKIISLMVERPSIQRINTLEDLWQSDLKFFVNLETKPHYAQHPIVGKLAVHGKYPSYADKIPDACLLWEDHIAEVLQDVTYDYEQRQPFYVALDYNFYDRPELFATSQRDPFLKVFRYVHRILVEAGLISLWKQQWREQLRYDIMGQRSKVDMPDKVNLDFNDMKSAWMVVGIGLGISLAGLLGEFTVKRFLKTNSVKQVNLTVKLSKSL